MVSDVVTFSPAISYRGYVPKNMIIKEMSR